MSKTLILNFITALAIFIIGLIINKDLMMGCGLVCLMLVSCTQVIYEKIEGIGNE